VGNSGYSGKNMGTDQAYADTACNIPYQITDPRIASTSLCLSALLIQVLFEYNYTFMTFSIIVII